MLWLGWRLQFADGRRAVVVFTVTVLTLALGTMLLLLVTSVPTALQSRADRLAWDDWSAGRSVAPESATPHLAVHSTGSFCTCGAITEVWVDPVGPLAPIFP